MEEFPRLVVPRQNIDVPAEQELKDYVTEVDAEAGRHEKQEECSPEVPQDTKAVGEAEAACQSEMDNDPEVQSIFHTFYTFRDDDLIIYTKHFSRFSHTFLCPAHVPDNIQGDRAQFDANIHAALYRTREPVRVKDEYHLTVKVVLDIQNGVPLGQPVSILYCGTYSLRTPMFTIVCN